MAYGAANGGDDETLRCCGAVRAKENGRWGWCKLLWPDSTSPRASMPIRLDVRTLFRGLGGGVSKKLSGETVEVAVYRDRPETEFDRTRDVVCGTLGRT